MYHFFILKDHELSHLCKCNSFLQASTPSLLFGWSEEFLTSGALFCVKCKVRPQLIAHISGPLVSLKCGKSLTFWTLQLLGWSCPLGNIFMGHSSSMWVLFAEGSWLNCQKSDTSRAPRCEGVEVTLRPGSSQISWKKIKYLSDTTCKVSTDRRL